MRNIITLTLAVLCLALQPVSAQKRSEGTSNYKYHKALEILQEDGDPAEARRLVAENIEENPKHIDSYMLLVAIDRNEEEYASGEAVKILKEG
jgi:Tfp pilus assembly protein PilF